MLLHFPNPVTFPNNETRHAWRSHFPAQYDKQMRRTLQDLQLVFKSASQPSKAPCSHSLHIPNDRFLACISQIVDRGSFPRRIPNASRPIYRFIRPRQVVPYFRMPRRSLIHDRPMTFPFHSTGVLLPTPYTQTFRKHNDRCSARSIDRE